MPSRSMKMKKKGPRLVTGKIKKLKASVLLLWVFQKVFPGLTALLNTQRPSTDQSGMAGGGGRPFPLPTKYVF